MRKRALISVADKTGLEELGAALGSLGFEIVASGGTARALSGAGVPVTEVSDVTGFPEVLGGRVKTLHPAVHAGILARRDVESDVHDLETHGVKPIDLVVSNLYPFEETWRSGAGPDDMIENIDIGGVTLIRAAAKNSSHVLVAVDPADYREIIDRLRAGTDGDAGFRRELAARAFGHTAWYDSLISWYMADEDSVPQTPVTFPSPGRVDLRYGENPHQSAALYLNPWGGGIARARLVSGPPLSYNNYQDAHAAWALAQEFDEPAAVAVKHATPCGVATASSLARAFELAREADPVSIFGGIVALNREVDEDTAAHLVDLVLDVVVAPSYTAPARGRLGDRPRLRVLEVGSGPYVVWPGDRWEMRGVDGGILVQERDLLRPVPGEWRVATSLRPDPGQMSDLAFAWTVVKHVRSNAIALARDRVTTGIGGGQVNRVEAARIAIRGAGDSARGSVMASDAFIPFPDTVEEAGAAGIRAVVQPGGSVRDDEVIEAAERLKMAMVFTGVRHFKH